MTAADDPTGPGGHLQVGGILLTHLLPLALGSARVGLGAGHAGPLPVERDGHAVLERPYADLLEVSPQPCVVLEPPERRPGEHDAPGAPALHVRRIRSLFDEGREVEASVQKVKRFRGGATLKLEYELDGIAYKVSSTFQRWPKTPVFSEGTRIALLVDPVHPRRAIPLALYADRGAARGGEPSFPAEHQS